MAGKRPPKPTDVPKGEPVRHARRSVDHTRPEPRNVIEARPISTAPAAPAAEAPRSSGGTGRHRSPERPRASKRAVAGRAARAAAPHLTGYAQRAELRQAAGAKPSVTGSTAKGAAAGASAGAAVGAVLAPVTMGLSEPVGLIAGGVIGGGVGAVSGSRKKKAWKRAAHADTAGPRRLILAEFVLCMIIVALSPLTDTNLRDKPGAWMKRMTALMILFLILSMVGSAGRGAAKVSAGLGGVIALVLLVADRDLLVKLAKIFGGGTVASRTPHRAPESGGVPGP